MRSFRILSILAIASTFLAVTAAAQSRDALRAELRRLNAEIDRHDESRDVNWTAQQIASRYGITRTAVLQDRRDCNCSWGQVMMAQSLSRSAGRPTSEIWRLREQGMGWGNIAHRYGTTLGEVMRDANKRVDWAPTAHADEKSDRGRGKGKKRGY